MAIRRRAPTAKWPLAGTIWVDIGCEKCGDKLKGDRQDPMHLGTRFGDNLTDAFAYITVTLNGTAIAGAFEACPGPNGFVLRYVLGAPTKLTPYPLPALCHCGSGQPVRMRGTGACVINMRDLTMVERDLKIIDDHLSR